MKKVTEYKSNSNVSSIDVGYETVASPCLKHSIS